MSPPAIYQQLKQFLEGINSNPLASEKLASTLAEITKFIAEIPTTFNEILPLERSLGVEIHKQLHLLKNDLLFWQAARQEPTKAQRWQQIQKRLATLTTYMQQLGNLEERPNE